MKKQIRHGLFETNSSSVHSIVLASGKEVELWRDGKFLYWGEKDTFITKDMAIKKLKTESFYSEVNWNDDEEVADVFRDERIQTYEDFFYSNEYKTFIKEYETPNNDIVVAFGYYGFDG